VPKVPVSSLRKSRLERLTQEREELLCDAFDIESQLDVLDRKIARLKTAKVWKMSDYYGEELEYEETLVHLLDNSRTLSLF
jgi:hypothetical protein